MPVSAFDQDDRLRWVERISRLLDSQFRVPGTTWRFGLDPIMGLIPVVGGLPSLAISGMLILTMLRHGASGSLVVRMVVNVVLDTLIGAIPVIGNIFDFAYKANDRNVKLLRAHYAEGKHQGSGKGLIAVLVLVLLALAGLIVWAAWTLGAALWHWGASAQW
ncbi:DUF4112 domain-containing protein [Hymenobacter rubripertinctus]|uniref:DUF4112 domain-containing protein n=1 Tax=Hymenobacter rubripertinctus TaxID=2029981 RepID=A0A418R0V7_9BACT|nr:DUF4112 domain-containing protein [Hymenobacter rubripertinctus]RIY11062.1 DUF4112 domain-containing protein [Hymenobacter rubripertinctus]